MAEDDAHQERARGLIKAIQNGAGALVARLMIIIGMPLVTALAAYSIKVTLENIALEIHQVSMKIDDAADLAKDAEVKVNMLQNDVGRLQEHSTNTDRRLDQLESRKR